MSKPTILAGFLEDQLLDSEGKNAAIHFFIYQYILSSDHSPINFIDLARHIGVPINDNDAHFTDLQGEGNEHIRFSNIRSWAYKKAFENKLKIGIEHLFNHPSKQQKISTQRQILECFATINGLIESGLSIKDLLVFFKTRFSDVLFNNNSDTFVTPSWVLSELISLQNMNSGIRSALDPSAKSGDFLLAALKNADLERISVTGVENDSSAGLIAEALLKSEGMNPDNLKLTSRIEEVGGGLNIDQKFDVVVCNPPFGKLPQPSVNDEIFERLGINRQTRSEVAFLKLGLSRLSYNGTAAFILPSIVLESDKYTELRIELIEQHGLHAVVLLPVNAFKHARVSTCLLMFNRAQTHDSVCFVDTTELAEKKADQDPFSNYAIDAIVSFVRDRPSIIEGLARTVLTTTIKEHSSKLNPKNYLMVPKAKSLLNQYPKLRQRYLSQFSELERLQSELNSLAKDQGEGKKQ